MVTLDTLFQSMAMKSALRSAYGGCNLDTELALLEPGSEGTSSPTKSTLSHNNTPFLPKIRVEECGLTVEARERDSWKRGKLGTGMRCWKPGKRRKSTHRGADDASVANAPTLSLLRDGFHTQEQREEESDAHSVKSTKSSLNRCPTSAFIGSLQVGIVPFSQNKARENARMGRGIRWPVGCLKYSTPRSSSTTQAKTESLLSLIESSKQRLFPLMPPPSAPSQSPSSASPRERVILNKLASKRKQQISQRHGKCNDETKDSENSSDRRIQSPIDYDQYLPTTHCAHLVNLASSTTKSSKYILRSDGLYDVIDDATRTRLEKLQALSSSSSSRNTSDERVASGSNTNTSGYESVDEKPSRTLKDHNKDCPLFNDFKPSDVGHFCPPNTPDVVASSVNTSL